MNLASISKEISSICICVCVGMAIKCQEFWHNTSHISPATVRIATANKT